jgi:fucose permease
MVPAVIYLVMILGQQYPKTERVQSNVSTGDMFKEALNPMFLLLFACMWMTAASELGPDQWFPSIMKELTGLEGVLFLVYTAGLMFVLRFFFGGVAHRFSPFGVLTVCSVLCAVGLYWLGGLSSGTSPAVAFMAATLFGIGKTYYWPTMLGVTSELLPKGGALLLALMGGAGMLCIAVILPIMGAAFDKAGPGRPADRWRCCRSSSPSSSAPCLLYYRARGGYRAVKLESSSSPREVFHATSWSSRPA